MEEILAVNPNNANALNYIGYTYSVKKVHMVKARKYIEKALRIKPGDAFIIDSYGYLFYQLGNYKKALKYLKEAAEIKSDEAIIQTHLGDAYMKLNLPDKARMAYKRSWSLYIKAEQEGNDADNNKDKKELEKKLVKFGFDDLLQRRPASHPQYVE